MELRNINTFLKVAATQNFSKAAEQLGYSQSAVTVQIQQLEKELETPLFERIGKRVFLTERGMEFTSYANEIMGRPTGPGFLQRKRGNWMEPYGLAG
jgi:DNA-binding transcriptional LysR family regulator